MSKKRQTPPPNSSGKPGKSPVELTIAKYRFVGTIITALLGLLGVVITAYFAYPVSQKEAVPPIKQTRIPSIDPTHEPTSAPPAQTNFPDIYVMSNAENGVQFTAPAVGNYRFTIKEGTYCWDQSPSKCRSVIRGYLNRDIEWGLWFNILAPINQDYELGCAEDEPNCHNQTTIVAMKAQQYITWVALENKGFFTNFTGYVLLSVEKLLK